MARRPVAAETPKKTTAKPVKKPFRSDSTAHAQALAAVAKDFKAFRPAAEVLTRVEAVPTIFPQYDSITRVAGHPIARITLVHGPSNEGKSSFVMGLGASFLKAGHFFGFVDAEKTTPPEWLDELMGPLKNGPGFVALPSATFEGTREAVTDFCEKIATHRAKGLIAEETTGLVVIDSLRKLVPKKLFDELSKAKSDKGIDGFGGRAGQMKAALNAAWMDELVPLMSDTNCAIVLIARETEDPNAGMFDEGIKVGGGKAVFYDASLAVRISRKFIPHPVEERMKKGEVIGERHAVEIRKTKVGKKDRKRPIGFFHTSNGTLSPAGFDNARDLLELAVPTGVVQLSGSWYTYDGRKLGNGLEAALRGIRGDVELHAALDRDVRLVACGRGDAQKEDDDES